LGVKRKLKLSLFFYWKLLFRFQAVKERRQHQIGGTCAVGKS